MLKLIWHSMGDYCVQVVQTWIQQSGLIQLNHQNRALNQVPPIPIACMTQLQAWCWYDKWSLHEILNTQSSRFPDISWSPQLREVLSLVRWFMYKHSNAELVMIHMAYHCSEWCVTANEPELFMRHVSGNSYAVVVTLLADGVCYCIKIAHWFMAYRSSQFVIS